MPESKSQFSSSDAWLLTSIYGASLGGEPTLSRVIGIGDFINHAIFTLSEINGGTGRLIRAGLITFDGTNYSLTPQGIMITEIDPKAKKGPFEHMETVRKRLHAPNWGPPAEEHAHGDLHQCDDYVSDKKLHLALEDYKEALQQPARKKANKTSLPTGRSSTVTASSTPTCPGGRT
jgi:hypothetical protein